MAPLIALVTGATAGIGEVTARELIRAGMHVIIVGRNQARTTATSERIRAATGSAPDLLLADLSSQQAIRQLADDVLGHYPQIDILINNAGALYNQRELSVDGIEMTWALNHMSYFLLTTWLMPALQAAPQARVINVASEAHRIVPGIRFDDPQFSRKYNGWQAYGQSKLANILFTVELARRTVGSGITANALHPGFVASNFGKNNRDFGGMLFGMLQRFVAISPDEGAKTSLFLATSPDVAGITGRYFDRSRLATPAATASDMSAAARLWEVSEQLVAVVGSQ
jgi:NAD(P)-dependent dehydrogenase (short-subunit alcohol dehydrogenase family)